MAPRGRAPRVKIKRYCAVRGCCNNNKTAPDTAFFSLPKDVDRRREWLVLIGREDLLRKRNISPKSYLVCAVHFEDRQMKTKISKMLKEDAVPSKRLPHQSQETDSNKHRKTSEDPIIIKSEPASPETVDVVSASPLGGGAWPDPAPPKREAGGPRAPRAPLGADKAVQTTVTGEYKPKRRPEEEPQPEDSETKRRRKDQTYREMIIGKPKKEAPVPEDPEDDITRRFHKLIEWQNKIKNKFRGNRFDSEYKTFALNLHYSSPHAYRCLQAALRLPSRSTIVRLRHTVRPVLDRQILDSLSYKLKALPADAKYCTLCLDEMPLKRNLHYDTRADQLTGLKHINGRVSPELADRAHVVMAQGMFGEWRLPVAYALAAGVGAGAGGTAHLAELDAWLTDLIRNLFAIGLEVRAVVSVQGSNFDKYSKAIKHVTVDRPYFFIDERKIYYILDAPNLLKCLLHDLLTNNFHHKGAVITFDYVRKLLDHQKEKNYRLIPKITSAHLESNKQKMKVRHALQVFSNAVYAALDTYIDFQQVSDYARETAQFLKAINDLFDVLNLSQTRAKGSKHTENGLRMTDEQKRILEESREMFGGMACADRHSGRDVTAQAETFLNFQITIRSIVNLFEDLKTEGFEYLYTRNLNQDCLEEFFGDIRRQQSGGSCAEPSPNQFTRAFSELFIGRMLKSSPAEAREPDIYEVLLKSEDLINNKIITPTADGKPSLVGLVTETDYQLELPPSRALTYVTSFLLYKCAEKHTCSEITAALRMLPDLEQSDLFAHFVQYNRKAAFYGKLKVPSRELHQYVETLEAAFVDNFEKYVGDRPGSNTYELLKGIPPSKLCGCFPSGYLVKLFVRLRIFNTLKLNNRNIKSANKSTEVRFTLERLE